MPIIGKACHELRVNDRNKTWRLFYHLDVEPIVILDVSEKKTQQTSKATLDVCSKRLKSHEEAQKQKNKR